MNAILVNAGGNAQGKTGWLEIVRQQVGSLRYGVVQIVVQDSRVTQIDKTERIRLERRRSEDIQGRPEIPEAK